MSYSKLKLGWLGKVGIFATAADTQTLSECHTTTQSLRANLGLALIAGLLMTSVFLGFTFSKATRSDITGITVGILSFIIFLFVDRFAIASKDGDVANPEGSRKQMIRRYVGITFATLLRFGWAFALATVTASLALPIFFNSDVEAEIQKRNAGASAVKEQALQQATDAYTKYVSSSDTIGSPGWYVKEMNVAQEWRLAPDSAERAEEIVKNAEERKVKFEASKSVDEKAKNSFDTGISSQRSAVLQAEKALQDLQQSQMQALGPFNRIQIFHEMIADNPVMTTVAWSIKAFCFLFEIFAFLVKFLFWKPDDCDRKRATVLFPSTRNDVPRSHDA